MLLSNCILVILAKKLFRPDRFPKAIRSGAPNLASLPEETCQRAKLLTASGFLKRFSDQTLTGLATLSGFRTLN